MIIFIGSDHRGFALKKYLKDKLIKKKYKVIDVGNYQYDINDDYPDISFLVGIKVNEHKGSRGILICGSGIGVCVAANKIKGVRAGLGISQAIIRKAREDDDINVLCLPADFINKVMALKLTLLFLKTKFKNLSRYKRRIQKIVDYENKNYSGN
ncbi:MAG: putative ribose-5-phosphate isomerase B [Candidatus Parcubacteria bacterium]|nr:MAG: putative ribose-5-phosphate isomerase B [Candidatus Parcubacteria bacterium]